MNHTTNKARRSLCVALGLTLGTSLSVLASATLNYQFVSPELPVGTRCLLVASTADSDFGQPGDLAGLSLTAGSVYGQDNVVLAVMTSETLLGSIVGCAGIVTVEYTGGLDAGDPLRLIWLPGLGAGAQVVPLGTGFVDYDSTLPADGGTIGYSLPADGATDSVYSIATTYGGTTSFPPSVPATIATYPAGQDTDGDQLGDLLEFAMGLDIYTISTPVQPALGYINGGTDIRFDFAQRSDLAIHGLTLDVESSLTLLDGSWFPVAPQPSATMPGRWEVIVPTPTGANARQFFRFKLTE